MAAEEKKGLAQGAKTGLKVILGVVFLVLGACLVYIWRWDVLTVIKGFMGAIVILIGIVLLAIAKE